MDDNAYLGELVAGIIFLLVGARLLKLGAQTREIPERVLGLSFVLIGVSYGLYQVPLAVDLGALLTPLFFLGRIVWDATCVTLAIFTRVVFRREERWAGQMVIGCLALVVAGVLGSIAYEDWEGGLPLSNPWFWVEWAGQTIPLAWASVEALSHYASARRRTKLRLCEPVVCNRFLLWATFGLGQVVSQGFLVQAFIEWELDGRFHHGTDVMLAACEFVSIGAIWLAFFPPDVYRGWIGRRAVAPQEIQEG